MAYVGSRLRISVAWLDSNVGAPFEPSDWSFTVVALCAGVYETILPSDPRVTHDGAGAYHFFLLPTAPGEVKVVAQSFAVNQERTLVVIEEVFSP